MKTTNYIKYFLLSTVFILGLTACEDNAYKGEEAPDVSGVYILNEGPWNSNGATLSFYDIDEDKMYENILDGPLGKLGQNMIIYGNYIYVTVSESGIISIIDKGTKEMIKTIPVKTESGESRQPRYLVAYGGKVYVTTFDGYVVRLDVETLTLDDALCKVGPNPEGIEYANNKLYVANSGGLVGYDNTVSVVNINTFTEEKKIEVGKNPYIIKADKYGNLYLTCRSVYNPSDFSLISSSYLQRINIATEKVTTIPDIKSVNITIDGDLCYYYDDNNPVNVGVYNTKTQALESANIISDETVISWGYAIGINPETKHIYVSSSDYMAEAYPIYIFSQEGKQIKKLLAGIGPNCFAFDLK